MSQIACEMAATVEQGWKQGEVEKALETTTKEMQDLHRLGLGFAEDYPDVNSLLQQVLASAITESQMWGIVRLLDEPRNCLVLRAWQGPPASALPPEIQMCELFDRSLDAATPVPIDIHQNPLWRRLLESDLAPARKAYLKTLRTIIHVPMRLKNRKIGIIFLESQHETEVPKRVLQFLGMLGGYAAVATELARARVLANSYSMTRTLIAQLPHKIGVRVVTLDNILKTVLQLPEAPLRLEANLATMQTEIDSLKSLCTTLIPFALEDDPATRFEVLDLADVVRKAKDSYDRSPHIGTPIKIDVISGGEFFAKGHPELLQQAFENLVANADEATTDRRQNAETGELIITLQKRERGIEISFKDNGIGMDGDMTSKCVQLGTTIKKDRGHGIGLAFVNGIMTMHGGHLSVQSELGQGSKLILTLPAGSASQ